MDSNRLETGFFVALLVAASYLSWLILRPYLSALVIAGTLAFLFQPLYKKLLRIFRYASIAALSVVAIVTLIIFVPLALFGARIFIETTTLYGLITSSGGIDLGATFAAFFHSIFKSAPMPEIVSSFDDSVHQGLTWFIQNLGNLFSGIAQAFFAAFLSLLGLFYLLKDGDRLKKWTLELIPLEPEYTEDIMREMEAALGSVVKGSLMVAIIQGVIAGAGFLIFGIPEPAFWGALTVLASLVPIVGAWLIFVPAIVYLFLTGQTFLGAGLMIWSLIFVNIIYNLVAPQLMHRGVNIHSYVILLSVLGGIGLFGPIGFLTGPLIVAFLFSLLNIYPKLILKRNGF